jgi:hypothetical protein
MEVSRSAKSHASTQNGGSGYAQLSRSKNDCFVEWPALVLISFA